MEELYPELRIQPETSQLDSWVFRKLGVSGVSQSVRPGSDLVTSGILSAEYTIIFWAHCSAPSTILFAVVLNNGKEYNSVLFPSLSTRGLRSIRILAAIILLQTRGYGLINQFISGDQRSHLRSTDSKSNL